MEAIKISFDNSMTEFKALKSKNQSVHFKLAKENEIPFTLKTYKEFVAE